MLVDRSGRLALFNQRTEKLFGYGPGALSGRDIEMLVPERFRSGHVLHRVDYSRHPLARAMGAHGELRGLRQDGSEFPVEISLGPVAVESEDFVIVVVRDVSQRQASELEHVQLTCEQEARYAAESAREELLLIVGEIGAIVWESDAERRRFRFVSKRAEQMLGYSLSAWLDEDGFWRRIVEPDDLALAELYFQEAVGRASDHEHEYRVRSADGRVLRVRDRVRVVLGEDGEPRLHGVTVDVTARLELEEDVIQAQKLDAVGQLAGGVAQDVDRLLAAIGGHTDVLLGQVQDDVSLAQLQEISLETGRGAALVAQLRAFGRTASRSNHLEVLRQARPGTDDVLETPRDGGAGRVVLVVEDESAMRRLVRSVLEKAGYRVREAASGRDALACLEQHDERIDLVLSDVMMAGITGPELLARMAPLGHATRLLFMSDYADSRLPSRGPDDCSIGVLHRPFTPAELSVGVAQIMSEQ